MNTQLKTARLSTGLTQVRAARRLGLSQTYVSLLEMGKRPVTRRLARKLMRAYGLAPTVLPPVGPSERSSSESMARELARLGYPGFAYLRSRGPLRNPAETLIVALVQSNLEARVVEALPWLLLSYHDMDLAWLLQQAKLRNAQNRLGYLTYLARQAAEFAAAAYGRGALVQLEQELEACKLVREDTLCRELPVAERNWLLENRPAAARHWRVLTDLTVDFLPYA